MESPPGFTENKFLEFANLLAGFINLAKKASGSFELRKLFDHGGYLA
jgi:hypothetical protein